MLSMQIILLLLIIQSASYFNKNEILLELGFTSIGHSTVVFLMSVLLGISVKWAKDELPYFQNIGGIIGTLVSGFFYFLLNIKFIYSNFINKAFARLRNEHIREEELDALLESRGFITRFIAPYFKLISRSWHVLPLGFLFGLGFDTASEIALLALSSELLNNPFRFRHFISAYFICSRNELIRYTRWHYYEICL